MQRTRSSFEEMHSPRTVSPKNHSRCHLHRRRRPPRSVPRSIYARGCCLQRRHLDMANPLAPLRLFCSQKAWRKVGRPFFGLGVCKACRTFRIVMHHGKCAHVSINEVACCRTESEDVDGHSGAPTLLLRGGRCTPAVSSSLRTLNR